MSLIIISERGDLRSEILEVRLKRQEARSKKQEKKPRRSHHSAFGRQAWGNTTEGFQ